MVRTPPLVFLGIVCLLAPACAEADVGSFFEKLLRPTPQVPHPAIVQVHAQEPDAWARGSGTLIASDQQHGWVLTNWHVVRGAIGPVQVVFPDGFQASGQVLKTDQVWDLALILIPRPVAAPIPLASYVPQVGEAVTISGYGQGSFRSARGKCTNYAAPDEHHPQEMIDVSVKARQGDSGGPILNVRGELVGVLFGSGQGGTTGTHVGRVRMFLLNPSSAMERLATGGRQPIIPPRQPAFAKEELSPPSPPRDLHPRVAPPANPTFGSHNRIAKAREAGQSVPPGHHAALSSSPAGFVSPKLETNPSESSTPNLDASPIDTYRLPNPSQGSPSDPFSELEPSGKEVPEVLPAAPLTNVAALPAAKKLESSGTPQRTKEAYLLPPEFVSGNVPKNPRPICDPKTGVCSIPGLSKANPSQDVAASETHQPKVASASQGAMTVDRPSGEVKSASSQFDPVLQKIRHLDDTSTFLIFVGCIGLIVYFAPRKR